MEAGEHFLFSRIKTLMNRYRICLSLVPVFCLLLAAAGEISAQSGRRTVPTPTPTPAVVKPAQPQYSESKPNPPRRRSAADKFPGIGDGTGTPAPSTAATAGGDDDIVKVETDLITIPVSVFDRNGLYVSGLDEDDFSIFEDGVEQEIAYFATTDKPFTIVLLLDTSPSTEYRIDDIQNAAIAFVDNLKPVDSVIVIEFAGSVHVLTDATTDRSRIYKAIKKASFGNGTSLYDAVDQTLRKRLGKIEGRKAVVLFTDGVDTTSRKATYESSLDIAEEADAPIFPIYYNTFGQQPLNSGSIGLPWPNILGRSARGQSAEEYALGRKYLEDLATYTGGRVFRPEATPGGLQRAFEGIAEELRRQYNIGYIPKEEGRAGQRKHIRVRVRRPNLVVRSRDSYIVGATQAKPSPSPSK